MQPTFYDIYNYPDGGKKRKDYWKHHLGKHINFSNLTGKKILDVGCGTGTISKVLSDAGADVHAIDFSRKSIEYVNKTYPEIKAKHGTALDIKFPNNFFDIVLSIGVLHHTPDTYKGFKECIRVCKPNGQIIILLYTKWHYYPLLYRSFQLIRNEKRPEKMPKIFINAVRKFTEWYYKEKRAEQDAIQLIADQFFTPIAKFHSEFEIGKWIRNNNCTLKSTSTTFFGEHKIYGFIKESPPVYMEFKPNLLKSQGKIFKSQQKQHDTVYG